MNVFYTSDHHFGHERIIELCYRPFKTVTQMNDEMVYRWNQVVAPEDMVWVLGDVAIGRPGLLNVNRLNGTKILVAGNHDACWEYHKRWKRWVREYMEAGFSIIHTEGTAVGYARGRDRVNIAHLPYRGTGDHTRTERYSEQRLEDDGKLLLCGHVHEAWKTKRTEAGTLMINVGVDQWDYTPVSQEQLIELAKEAP